MEHTNKPLVSILTTVFNREKYLASAIESVLNSTYSNWELIIVDDQSTDNSIQIAKDYANLDNRLKVFVNEKNLGDYKNRNRAASYAKGKYLKYIDADDLIYPFGLEQLVLFMEQFPDAGYGLCSLDQDPVKQYPFELGPYESYYYHYFKRSIFHKAPLSSIIRKDAFDRIGGFTGKQHVGDFELWHLLSQTFPVVLMPQGIVWYREHDDQQMSDNRSDPYVPFKYLLIQEQLILSDKCPLSEKEKKVILRRNKLHKSKLVMSAFRRHSFKKGKQLLKDSNQNLFTIGVNVLMRN